MDSKQSFYAPCTCGCEDSVHFQAAHGTIYASFLRSEFYSQQSPIRGAIRERFKYVFLKKTDIREILVTREILESLKSFLEDAVCTEPDSSDAVGSIVVDHVFRDVYSLVLSGKVSAGEVLTGGFHRMFDLELNDKNRLALIASIEDVLSKPVDDNEKLLVVESHHN